MRLSFGTRWVRALTLGLGFASLALLGLVCSSPILRAGVCVREITPISPDLVGAYESAFGGPPS